MLRHAGFMNGAKSHEGYLLASRLKVIGRRVKLQRAN